MCGISGTSVVSIISGIVHIGVVSGAGVVSVTIDIGATSAISSMYTKRVMFDVSVISGSSVIHIIGGTNSM